MDLQKFFRQRPYLYHLTDSANLPLLRKRRRLHPTKELLREAGRESELQTLRRTSLTVTVAGHTVVIRDQAPLHKRKTELDLDLGFTFEELVESLNSRVFFWPGTTDGPNAFGTRHFSAYKQEAPTVFKIPFTDLLAANSDATPLFSRFNSRSPRWNHRIQSPSGLDTFFPLERFDFHPSRVVEITFLGSVELPESTKIGSTLSGPWEAVK